MVHTIAKQCVLQMVYNNYCNNKGYIQGLPLIDYNIEDVCNAYNWHLDYESLTLQRPFLNMDCKDIKPFEIDLEDIIIQYSSAIKQSYVDQCKTKGFLANQLDCESPLHKLDEKAKEYIDKHFRGLGLKTYYEIEQNRVSCYADTISFNINSYLFGEWKLGKLGFAAIVEVVKEIIRFIGKTKFDIQRHIERLNYDLESNDEVCEGIRRKYDEEFHCIIRKFDNRGVLGRLLLESCSVKYLSKLTDNLPRYYVSLAEIEACNFSQLLLQQIENRLKTLHFQLCDINQTLLNQVDNSPYGRSAQIIISDKDFMKIAAQQVRVYLSETIDDKNPFLSCEEIFNDHFLENISNVLIPYLKTYLTN